jgi:MYXO-CTERM domain-containing protein
MAGRCDERGECDGREIAVGGGAVGVGVLGLGLIALRRRRRVWRRGETATPEA